MEIAVLWNPRLPSCHTVCDSNLGGKDGLSVITLGINGETQGNDIIELIFFSHNELEYILNGFRDLHEKKL